jgi:hypothetical protein
MKKIPCVFKRDFSDKRNPKILNEVTLGCEWVLAGEGVATRKRDGTAVLIKSAMVRELQMFKRYDAKRGKEPPVGFEPASDPDPVTGHWPGWLRVDTLNPDPADVWHALAYWQVEEEEQLIDGTFELCGPRINSNHEGLRRYEFFRHGTEQLDTPRTFEGLREYLQNFNGEGIVFWRDPGNRHSDMAKITRENFGFAWPIGDVK